MAVSTRCLVAGVVRRVAVAVAAQQDTGLELLGQCLGPLERRGRVAGRAGHEDQGGTLAADVEGLLGRAKGEAAAGGQRPGRRHGRRSATPPRRPE